MEKWAKLDEQFQNWSPRLRDDLRIGAKESNKLATTIALELSQIPEEKAREVRGRSVIPFEAWIRGWSIQGFDVCDRPTATPDPLGA